MKSVFLRFLMIVCCFFYGAAALSGQEAPQEEIAPPDFEEEDAFAVPLAPNYQERPAVNVRKVEAQQWDKAAKGLDYSKDVYQPLKKRRSDPDSLRNQRRRGNSGEGSERDLSGSSSAPFKIGQGFATFIQVIAILLLVGLVAYGVYVILKQPRSKKIAADGTEITLENVEHYIHETDLERFLREALAKNDYNQAIRLYYLQIIKDLSLKNAIQWSREKTNRQYLREMRQHPLSTDFQRLTQTFERVWYGNTTLGAQDYAALEPSYKSFLNSI
ncbi:MAG: DUF4129 domain-containing protein [Chitinophagales bacterium]|nr:DUF4129 domain-containing protein [Chitinophagales bacterium]